MKRMLFDASHSEELRVAVVDGQTLVDLDIDSIHSDNKKGNIYKGIITKIEPSLEAAFVDYGTARHGFLSLKDISRNYFKASAESGPISQVKIQDAVSVGDRLVVQVDKEERGNKGATLTTFISLAGRYLVLLPNNTRGGGISRQIEGSRRAELKDIMSQLEIPEPHSVIARTAGIGQSVSGFKSDLEHLLTLWEVINKTAEESPKPFLIYQESSLIVRALRDYLRDDIGQILVDDPEIYEQTKKVVKEVMPQSKVSVQLYTESDPLFSRYQIEHQIQRAFERKVSLPGGGAIVIDQTEALVTIDVNSARATKGADIEETALKTNLEAVEQIAKQLRLRDIGGLIVIDLIDMSSSRNKKNVEQQFIESLRNDRARVRVGRISKFGLLEMSRQRMRSSIDENSHVTCPRCDGRGYIRNVMSSGLSILRILEEEATKENIELIHAHLPIETATFLINEKRDELGAIEKNRQGAQVVVIPTTALDPPDYRITRFKGDEVDSVKDQISYTIQYPNEVSETYNFYIGQASQRPAVAQNELNRQSDGLYGRQPSPLVEMVKTVLFGAGKTADAPAPEESPPAKKSGGRRSQPRRQARKPASGNTKETAATKRRSSQGRSKDSSQSRSRQPRPQSGNRRQAKPDSQANQAAQESDSNRGNQRRRSPRRQSDSTRNPQASRGNRSRETSSSSNPPP